MTYLALIFLLPASLVVAYYLALAVVGLVLPARRENRPEASPVTRFAIIVPAHNEEEAIRTTIESCQALDYPPELVRTVVIADNCTDATATIAHGCGAEVLERNDERRRGKGFALAWAFEHLLQEPIDAFLILDADCVIEPHALQAFDGHFRQSALVLQANDVTSNPDESPMSYALAVGNLLENDLFYAPKSALGLAVLLRGTGMVFHRSVLERTPWDAYSVAEDADYSLRLLRAKVSVTFVKEVRVASAFPVSGEQLDAQRTRWAEGNLSLSRSQAFGLMLNGLSQANLMQFDGGWTLLVLSRPLVMAVAVVAFALSLLGWLLHSGPQTALLLSWSLSLLAGLVLYFGLGILLQGMTRRRLGFILRSPLLVWRLARISLRGLFGGGKKGWTRTPRG